MKKIIILLLCIFLVKETAAQWTTQLYLPSYTKASKRGLGLSLNKYYAVGENGAVRKSSDMLNSWTELFTGSNFDLFSVAMNDTNNIIVGGDFGTIIKTTNAGVNWITLDPGTTDIIRSICYFGLNTIVAGGQSGRVFRSTNSGANWTSQTLPGTSGNILDMESYSDSARGLLCTGTGEVFKTTNKGLNWINTSAPATSSYNTLEINLESVFIGGDDGKIIYSSNQGTNWLSLAPGTTSDIIAISVPLVCCYIVAACEDGSIIYTTHVLTPFITVIPPGENSPRYNCFAYGPGSGGGFVALGEQGSVIKSSNFGLNWSQVQGLTGTGRGIEQIYFPSPLTGYAVCGTEYLLKTSNGGANWSSQVMQGTYPMSTLHFVNTLTGFAGGNNGTINDGSAAVIEKTTNGGLNWISTTIPSTNTISSMYFHDVNTGWVIVIASGSEKLFKTTNSGGSWSEIYSFNQEIAEIHFVNQQTGWVLGETGTVGRTTNGGTTWQNAVTLPGNLFGISFPSPTTGFICGTSGAIYRTTNSGQNWSALSSGTSNTLTDIHFASELNGMCVGESGTRLLTINGGINWVLEHEQLNIDMNSCYMSTAVNGYAAGSIGYISYFGGIITGSNTYSNELPVDFALSQNYPNPFNPETRINYDIPASSHVKLIVYDVSGREVKQLVNGSLQPGKYYSVINAAGFSSGVYFYRLEAGSFVQTKKMILIK